MLNKDHVKISEALYFTYNILPSFIHPTVKSILYHPTIPLTITAMEALGIFIGSQLPDIDTPNSKIGQCIKPISKIINKFGHRGITHSLWFFLVILILALVLKPFSLRPFYLCIAIGVLLHILEDSFSKAGVIWFFPLGKYHMWSKGHTFCRTNIHTTFRYKTGGLAEKLISNIALACFYIEVAFYFYFLLE